MLIADALQLALRAITAQRLRSFLTLLGIAVGIAAVILLTSIGEGIHRFVLGEFTQFGTNVITAIPGKTKTGGSPSGLPSSARPLSLEDAKSLERLPHVVAVTPNVRGNAEVEGNGRTRRTLIYGVNANLPKIFRSTVQSGQFLPADDESSARAFVVLGSKVKNELFGSENPLPWGADAATKYVTPAPRNLAFDGTTLTWDAKMWEGEKFTLDDWAEFEFFEIACCDAIEDGKPKGLRTLGRLERSKGTSYTVKAKDLKPCLIVRGVCKGKLNGAWSEPLVH